MRIKIKFVFMLILTGLILSGCGDQAAIDRAKADQIRQQTADESAAREADEARKQADWEAKRVAVNRAKTIFLTLVGFALAIMLAFTLLTIAFRAWQVTNAVTHSIAVYAERRAALRAGTIKVDRDTRTFPALVADGAIHNLETGQVYPLGKPQRADPQQVTASAQIRALGVMAQAAERIGKSTKDAQAGDALPGLGASVPLVLPSDVSTLIVENDASETVDL